MVDDGLFLFIDINLRGYLFTEISENKKMWDGDVQLQRLENWRRREVEEKKNRAFALQDNFEARSNFEAKLEAKKPLYWHRWVTVRPPDFCWWCGEKKIPKLKRCARCKSVYYCGVECQAKHWRNGGHRGRCLEPALAHDKVELHNEYPGMFPLINRDLPAVDDKILSYLSPRDLTAAKSVCKKWYSTVHMNMRIYAEIVAVSAEYATQIPSWQCQPRGEIVAPPSEGGTERFGVRIPGYTDKAFVRRECLIPLPDAETVGVCRLAPHGEEVFHLGIYQVWIFLFCTTSL